MGTSLAVLLLAGRLRDSGWAVARWHPDLGHASTGPCHDHGETLAAAINRRLREAGDEASATRGSLAPYECVGSDSHGDHDPLYRAEPLSYDDERREPRDANNRLCPLVGRGRVS